eukprot:CAMPEP_0175077130 /NCGR_PEP_ID=MMETSP0052_2-20121109/23187_1 /TAXON_ID=51329 ORGANISM="Polytomella parva, Strain SAG 63-3" /NCGR_SAMPLE_ID=MMETSP0052_2 /ASSEMBLY_ACC=CAM_ASM_000194 /LENGTH=365 /DNA_ID=CAMNT_0016346497 /DNA_START=155 /DNA_END=1253 /DNA_ORIENTATION=-
MARKYSSSFSAAAKTGIQFVEFDVQVNSDNIPVIFHDDMALFSESEASSANESSNFVKASLIHQLSLPEFRSLVSTSPESTASKSKKQLFRHFRDLKSKSPAGFHAWHSVSDEDALGSGGLPTLEELFQRLPLTLGFNIEVKMCNLSHAPSAPYDPSLYPRGLPWDFGRTADEEVERMLTPILKVVEQYCPEDYVIHRTTEGEGVSEEVGSTQRAVFFSSFDPEICIALRRRQSRFPVLFLSGCGIYQIPDSRCTSAQAALDFAREHNLTGLVVPSEVLLFKDNQPTEDAPPPPGRPKVNAAWLAAACQEAELELLTYGDENMDRRLTGKLDPNEPKLYGNLPGVTGAITDRADLVVAGEDYSLL